MARRAGEQLCTQDMGFHIHGLMLLTWYTCTFLIKWVSFICDLQNNESPNMIFINKYKYLHCVSMSHDRDKNNMISIRKITVNSVMCAELYQWIESEAFLCNLVGNYIVVGLTPPQPKWIKFAYIPTYTKHYRRKIQYAASESHDFLK